MNNEQKLAIIFAGLAFLAGLAIASYGSTVTKDSPGLRGLVNSEEFQKTRKEVTRDEAGDKERKLPPRDFAKEMLEKANKAAKMLEAECIESGVCGI